MKAMKWLIRRECWEHKGSFFWAPLIVSAMMMIFVLFILGLGLSADGIRGSSLSMLAGPASDAQKAQLINVVNKGYIFVSTPILMTYSVIVFFYCLSSLYDERRDHSILFWKSLPVSDAMTVLSKIAMAVVVFPLITIAVATITSLLVLLMFCLALAIKGTNVFGMVLTTPALYLTPLQIVGLIPVYLLWALPTIGWLMMVSAWARSKVFLWGVGAPMLSVAMLVWAESMFHFQWNIGWYLKNIIARMLMGTIPGAWIPFAGIEKEQLLTQDQSGIALSNIFTQSWATLTSFGLWVGVAAGVTMIYMAILLRRWRGEG